MKRIIKLIGLTAVAAMFQGCAGYNTTMFMTKSNAGLDIDMKPPTAEINISRKEAVIEPVFEKGQTPPVMASFKPDVGFGGVLGNYFLGVDQTFAGGDAALTMAMLYDSATPPNLAGDEVKFDSTIELEAPIPDSNILFDPAPPGVIRPFIFGTDTQLGLKVAWSGAGGQFPDTVKAGFNRKEFAWAPLTMTKGGKSIKMPSFLATIQSHIGGESSTNKSNITNITTKVSSPRGGNGAVSSITNIQLNVPDQSASVKSIQYFATGEAASLLARQKDVRDAMLKRLDPSYSSTATDFGTGIVAKGLLSMMELTLSRLGTADPPDQAALVFWSRLQKLQGVQLPVSPNTAKPPMVLYSSVDAPETNVFKANTNGSIHEPTNPVKLDDVTRYMLQLEVSMKSIKQINHQLASNTNGVFLLVDNSTNQLKVLQADSMEIGEQLQIQKSEYDRVQKDLATDKDVLSAFNYFKNKYLTKP